MSNYAPVLFTGNGVTATQSLPWPYIEKEHVKALVNGVPATFTFDDSSTIRFDVVPAVGVEGIVFRETPDTAPVIFTTGQIESSKLTLASKLALFRAAESVENTHVLMGDLRDQAVEAKEAAEDAKADAATSATLAANDRAAALEHKNAAGVSEANATAQAVISAGWADVAEQHAQTAGTNAAAAETHKNAAGSQASAASASALDALTARLAVEGIQAALLNADFGGHYIPPSATDPTTRVGGGALVGGELYYNTAGGGWKRYNGSAWTTAFGVANPVSKSGDSMLGFLSLFADPTSPLHAATKQYVDAQSLAGGQLTGKLTAKTPDATTSYLNIGQAAADPSSPINGDLWATSSTMTVRLNGVNRVLVLRQSSNTYSAGAKQTMQGNSTTAGFRIATQSGDPSSLSDGDIWYNSTTQKLSARINSVSVNFLFEGSDIPMTDVTGLDAALAAKANASHSHALADVTGLDTALAGKSDVGHSHAFSTITSKPTTLAGYGITDGGGKVLQVVNTKTGAVSTGTTQMPSDDTIPTSSEGKQYMSLIVTPQKATSTLRIDVVCHVSVNTNAFVGVALYRDAGTSAIAVAGDTVNSTWVRPIVFTHFVASGSTTPTEFKVRAGQHGSATLTFNGSASARLYGGMLASSITITEIE